MTPVGWTFTGTGFVLGIVAIVGLIVTVATILRRLDQQDIEIATLRHLLARRPAEVDEPDIGQQVATVDELLGDPADVTDTSPQPVPYPRQRVNDDAAAEVWTKRQTAWADGQLTRFRFQPGERDGTRHRHRPLPIAVTDVGPPTPPRDYADGGFLPSPDAGDGGGD